MPESVFYDTEFVENGTTIDLLSIGMVDQQDTDPYYAVNSDADWERAKAHPWVGPNVVAHIPMTRIGGRLVPDGRKVRTRCHAEIAREVDLWLQNRRPAVRLWSWYPAYDHVALAQLWGTMRDMPRGIPWTTCDLQQEAYRLGLEWPKFAPRDTEHHALADARQHRTMYRWLGAQERALYGKTWLQ